LRKIGARYLSKEMHSFTTFAGTDSGTGNGMGTEEEVASVLFVRAEGSQAPKLTSLNGVPLRCYGNSVNGSIDCWNGFGWFVAIVDD